MIFYEVNVRVSDIRSRFVLRWYEIHVLRGRSSFPAAAVAPELEVQVVSLFYGITVLSASEAPLLALG